MALIPEPLTMRFELLRQLEKAYDLLDALQSAGTGTEAEESFLSQKINSIEEELGESEADAERIIDQLKSDPLAWTVARLRFMQGYEWCQAAARAGISGDVARTRVYRFFKKAAENRPEQVVNRPSQKAPLVVSCSAGYNTGKITSKRGDPSNG